jgi:hypothetical protein
VKTQPKAVVSSDEIRLDTIPRHVYKENDGVDKPASTESWVFNVLVKEKVNVPALRLTVCTVLTRSPPA